MAFEPQSPDLLLTALGRTWLEQFTKEHHPLIRQLTDALALVSTQEFERTLQRSIEKLVKDCDGPVALYAAREVPSNSKLDFREGGSGLNSVYTGSDLGSEARVASLLRQLCRTQKGHLLRQPSIESLLQHRVHDVIIVDDVIGSGRRIWGYLDQLWNDSTTKSWWSYKKIRFTVLAYAGTTHGVNRVSRHPCKPNVQVHRYCPTVEGLPWPRKQLSVTKQLCRSYSEKYALRASHLGFGNTAALLVFEHGCPNNVPNIFWADSKRADMGWQPLFPGRAAVAETASVFPTELAARTPVSVLLAARQERVAGTLSSVMQRPLPQNIIITLALLGRGIHRVEAIAHATNLSVDECKLLLETCVAQGLISPRRRLTDAGVAELKGIATAVKPRMNDVLKLGEDCYYPKSLRDRSVG
ncbi:hypothetical protein G9Q38_14285 [Pusillimonas sp. DMV24BSW_D]|uniref:phosphoribosyltransferase-like protein n=1 Tax=Neopusillimonas aestuarii TaxID=2716226 RepID=UPI00140A1518|nr:hypothetical protein [Pusillimonas sp. DMV24BSW_D]QIM50235.1 hypothetical protein G9Q38_14285 [Pusillimonas sp. DMV24BSW_D]